MATSKILIDGVGIDLTSDTVTADKLASGYTAHDASGAVITGTGWPPASVAAGDTPVMINPAENNGMSSTSYADSSISLTIPKAGAYRFRFCLTGNKVAGSNTTGYAKLYVNGTAQGSEFSKEGTGVLVASQDLTVSAGDTVKIWAKTSNSSYPARVACLVACVNGNNGF